MALLNRYKFENTAVWSARSKLLIMQTKKTGYNFVAKLAIVMYIENEYKTQGQFKKMKITLIEFVGTNVFCLSKQPLNISHTLLFLL